jgi:hypothetical protein
MGATGQALAMCGLGTFQTPVFDEEERLADSQDEKAKSTN